MRQIRNVTAKESNCRVECMPGTSIQVLRCDPIEPEQVGTIVMLPFRIVGYDKDCDGSLMARLENIDLDGRGTGWYPDCIAMCGDGVVVTLDELKSFRGMKA